MRSTKASLAIEVDGEFYALFASRPDPSAAVQAYVALLVAYADNVFSKEIEINVQLSYLGIHTNAATDPFPNLPMGGSGAGLVRAWAG